MARACFVTATDTGAGKTILTAAIAAALAASGCAVKVRKPVLTGIGGSAASADTLEELDDDALLAAMTGERVADIAFARYEPAVSPHLAAELTGVPLDVPALIDRLQATASEAEALIVEGIGGLLVPLAPGWDVRALAAALGFPVVIAARPGLGTLNHTLLTLEAARRGGLDVRAVVLTPWPAERDTIADSNRATLERLGEVVTETLPLVEPLTREGLAAAGAALPYEHWLSVSPRTV